MTNAKAVGDHGVEAEAIDVAAATVGAAEVDMGIVIFEVEEIAEEAAIDVAAEEIVEAVTGVVAATGGLMTAAAATVAAATVAAATVAVATGGKRRSPWREWLPNWSRMTQRFRA
jgi:hypothetical protein